MRHLFAFPEALFARPAGACGAHANVIDGRGPEARLSVLPAAACRHLSL